jgi:hypothetical protein
MYGVITTVPAPVEIVAVPAQRSSVQLCAVASTGASLGHQAWGVKSSRSPAPAFPRPLFISKRSMAPPDLNFGGLSGTHTRAGLSA